MKEVQYSRKILTISIAAYNSEKYLAKCLDSITKCKAIDKLEIFVINDGSTDSTQMIAEQYQKKYPASITVINKENGGHGSTINCSMKLATGKYFKIVDADDWVNADGIDRVVSYLEQTTADLVLNPYTHVNAENKITLNCICVKLRNRIEYEKEYNINTVQDVIKYETHMIMFRTDILKRIRKPITEYCYYVDMEYILYPLPYVQTVVFLDYVLYRYFVGRSDSSINMQNMIRRRNEHLCVTRNLIRFYYSCKNKKNVNGIKLIHAIVLQLIRTQYAICFKMKNLKEGKKEAIQFENWLKEKCDDLYDDVLYSGCYRSVALLKLLRKTKFNGYSIVLTILHAIGLGD